MDGILKKTAFGSLSRHLNLGSVQRKVISHNIANVSTPGYERKEMIFKDVLQKEKNNLALTTTQKGHLKSRSDMLGKVTIDKDTKIKNGINNVDIDQEMVDLAQNQMEFNTSATIMTRLFKSIKGCIKGRPDF